jgi:broad specificity phosphatase PhoE
MSVYITYTVTGSTIDMEQGRASGWNDPGLSERGIAEARELKKGLGGQIFDAVYSSDLKRAIETADIAFGEGNFEVDDRLRETNYGELNGAPKSFKKALEQYIDAPFPGGESYRDVELRVREFVKYLKNNHEGKTIAIVSNQAPQLALDVILNGKSWPEAMKSHWHHTGAWQPGWPYIIP